MAKRGATAGGRRSKARRKRRRGRREAWTPDKYWQALRAEDKQRVAETFDCSVANVYAQARKFRAGAPGGAANRFVVDQEVPRVMAAMMDEARFEVLAAAAGVSASPPPVLDHLLDAARRGVDVRLLFRAESLSGALVALLQEAGVTFRTMTDLQAKFLITDTTALNGSASFTVATSTRAAQVGLFVSDEALVHELREVFQAYWQRAQPY